MTKNLETDFCGATARLPFRRSCRTILSVPWGGESSSPGP